MTIAATITSLTIAPRKVGEILLADISYTISGTGAALLNPVKIFIVAKDNMGNKKELKGLTLWQDSYSGEDTLNMWQMPNATITVEVRIYWHSEVVGWDWTWWK